MNKAISHTALVKDLNVIRPLVTQLSDNMQINPSGN